MQNIKIVNGNDEVLFQFNDRETLEITTWIPIEILSEFLKYFLNALFKRRHFCLEQYPNGKKNVYVSKTISLPWISLSSMIELKRIFKAMNILFNTKKIDDKQRKKKEEKYRMELKIQNRLNKFCPGAGNYLSFFSYLEDEHKDVFDLEFSEYYTFFNPNYLLDWGGNPEPRGTLNQILSSDLFSGVNLDFKIKHKTGYVDIHSIVLRQCPYFNNVLTYRCTDEVKRQSFAPIKFINLEEYSKTHIDILIDYLYSKSTKFIGANVDDLLQLADFIDYTEFFNSILFCLMSTCFNEKEHLPLILSYSDKQTNNKQYQKLIKRLKKVY